MGVSAEVLGIVLYYQANAVVSVLTVPGPRADDGDCVSSRGSRRTARRLGNTEAGTKPAKWTGEFVLEKILSER